MTSSNGNVFRVSGPLQRECIGDRCIPLTKASDAELWCFIIKSFWNLSGVWTVETIANIKRLAKWKHKYREKSWFYGTSYFNGLAEKLILHTLFGIIWLAPGESYHYNFEVLGKYSLLIHHVVGTGIMMTSSNGNIFCVRGHLGGEFAGHRRIPRTKATDAELWCFLWSEPE